MNSASSQVKQILATGLVISLASWSPCAASQATETPRSSAQPPSTEQGRAAFPLPRVRSVTLPDDSPTPPVEQAPPSIRSVSFAAPPISNGFSVRWHDSDRRVAVYSPDDMREQGAMFGRIALMVETRGAPKTEVIAQKDLPAWLDKHQLSMDTVTAGNNLRANELARFFNTAHIQNEPLTQPERTLLTGLIEVGILRRHSHSAQVVQAAQPEKLLITIPKPSSVVGCQACTVTSDTAAAILAHELGHARFFVDAPYRDYSLWFWSHGMPRPAHSAFLNMLKTRGYDDGNTELLANEMQAFLLHTPGASLFSAEALGISSEELAELRVRFISGLEAIGLSVASLSISQQISPVSRHE